MELLVGSAQLGGVSGLDGASDQGRRHVAVGQNPVVEVTQAGTVEDGVVNFTITVELTDADSLVKPGMTAGVNIVVEELRDVLLVPNRAVRLVDGERVVYILENGQPMKKSIRLGSSSDTQSIVAGGDVTEGDLIILNPPAEFGPGGPGRF